MSQFQTTSIYEEKLMSVHQKSLDTWRAILTKPGIKPDVLGPAFGNLLAVSGNKDSNGKQDWKDVVSRGDSSVLGLCLPKLFPRLSPLVSSRFLEDIVEKATETVVKHSQDELAVILKERNLPEKLRDLEKHVKLEREGGDSTSSTLPAPLELMPADEMRSTVMAAKSAYETQIRAQLDLLRKENGKLEREVENMDSRARIVKQSVESKVKIVNELGHVAEEVK
jgi:hypothetical protein